MADVDRRLRRHRGRRHPGRLVREPRSPPRRCAGRPRPARPRHTGGARDHGPRRRRLRRPDAGPHRGRRAVRDPRHRADPGHAGPADEPKTPSSRCCSPRASTSSAVAHGGYTIPAHLRIALEVRDPKCIVPGCDRRRNLQIDHRNAFGRTRVTKLEDLARLCRWHHYLKTFLGYTYRGGPGTWEWIPPDTRTSTSPPPQGHHQRPPLLIAGQLMA